MAIELQGMAPLLLVSDINRSIAFYRDLLGFELVSVSGPDYGPGWALLRLGTSELMVNGGAHGKAPGGTALYFGCPDLDETWSELKARGIDIPGPQLTAYGFRSIALNDPDGYSLVFHFPATPETRADWAERYGPESVAPRAT